MDANSAPGKHFKKNQRRKRKKKEAKTKDVEKDGLRTDDGMDSGEVGGCEVAGGSEKNISVKDSVLSPLAGKPEVEAGLTESPFVENKATKKTKKREKIKKRVENTDEIQSIELSKVNTGTIESLVEGTRDRAENRNEGGSMNQDIAMLMMQIRDENNVPGNDEQEKNFLDRDVSVQPSEVNNINEVLSIEQITVEMVTNGTFGEGCVKKKSRRAKWTRNKDIRKVEEHSMNQVSVVSTMHVTGKNDMPVALDESENNLPNMDVNVLPLAEHVKIDASVVNEAAKKAEYVKTQSVEQPEVNTEKTLAEVNVNGKRKRRRKRIRKKVNTEDQVENIYQDNPLSKEQLPYENQVSKSDELAKNILKDVPVQSLVEHAKFDMNPINNPRGPKFEKNKKKRRRKKEAKKKAAEKDEPQATDQMDCSLDTSVNITECRVISESESNFLDEGLSSQALAENFSRDGGSTENPCQGNKVTKNKRKQNRIKKKIMAISSSGVKEEEYPSEALQQYRITVVMTPSRRKLLVLDLNGLLADIVMPAPKGYDGIMKILRRAIFRRPFCDDFLEFCFQNFDIGIWSSRSKKVIDKVVDYLLGHLKEKLVFCWDMSHCTQTTFKCLENKHKFIVFKELRRIWENDDTNSVWKKGDYDESNTLLLDDSPYKSLLNPSHSAIFPNSYDYQKEDDNSLGPGGDLRVYLEGLLTSNNVQKYVEQHPFDQSAINETSSSWAFYSRVLQSVCPTVDYTPSSLPT